MYSEKNLDQQHEWQFTKPSSAVLCNRAIFGQVLGKHSRIDLVLLYFAVIGPKNSRHSINQSDSKMNQVSTWSVAFSRAPNYSSLVPCNIFDSFDWDRMAFTFAYGPPADHKQTSINVFVQFNRGVIRHFELLCCSFAPRFPVPCPSSFVPRSKFQKHLFCSYITPREGSISSDLPCRQKERLKLLETTQITTWKPRNSSAIWAVVLVTGTAKGLVLEK